MTILGVVINIGATEHVCYHPNYKSLKDIRDNLDKFDVAVLVFENFENSFFVLDLKKLFSVQDLLAFNNWEDLHQFVEHQDADWLSLYMGTAIVPTHMQINDTTSVLCPFGSFTGNQMKIFSFENGNYGDVELGDAGSPYHRDSRINSPRMKDVVFSNLNGIDIENSIPVIYGCAFKPSVWVNEATHKKEMFALQAGRVLSYAKWNQKRVKTAPHSLARNNKNDIIGNSYAGGEAPVPRSYYYNEGILMLDFSPLGTIDIIDGKDLFDIKLTLIGHNNKDVPRTNLVQTEDEYRFDPNDWVRGEIPVLNATSFKLSFLLPPEQKSGIPIVCIFGRLLFVQEYVSIHDTSKGLHVTVTLPKDLLERILLSNMQHYGHHIDGTTNIQVLLETALKHLFSTDKINYINPDFEDLKLQKYTDFVKPFVVMLHTKSKIHLSRIKPKMTIMPDKLVFPANSGGLLVNTRTLEIIDYVRVNYKHDTLVTYPMQCPLNMLQDGSPDKLVHPQLGYENYKANKEQEFLKYSEFSRSLRTPDAFELVDISYLNDKTQSGGGIIPNPPDTPDDPGEVAVVEYDRVITDWMRPLVEFTDNPETPEDDPQTIIWPNKESTNNG